MTGIRKNPSIPLKKRYNRNGLGNDTVTFVPDESVASSSTTVNNVITMPDGNPRPPSPRDKTPIRIYQQQLIQPDENTTLLTRIETPPKTQERQDADVSQDDDVIIPSLSPPLNKRKSNQSSPAQSQSSRQSSRQSSPAVSVKKVHTPSPLAAQNLSRNSSRQSSMQSSKHPSPVINNKPPESDNESDNESDESDESESDNEDDEEVVQYTETVDVRRNNIMKNIKSGTPSPIASPIKPLSSPQPTPFRGDPKRQPPDATPKKVANYIPEIKAGKPPSPTRNKEIDNGVLLPPKTTTSSFMYKNIYGPHQLPDYEYITEETAIRQLSRVDFQMQLDMIKSECKTLFNNCNKQLDMPVFTDDDTPAVLKRKRDIYHNRCAAWLNANFYGKIFYVIIMILEMGLLYFGFRAKGLYKAIVKSDKEFGALFMEYGEKTVSYVSSKTNNIGRLLLSLCLSIFITIVSNHIPTIVKLIPGLSDIAEILNDILSYVLGLKTIDPSNPPDSINKIYNAASSYLGGNKNKKEDTQKINIPYDE